MAANTSKGLQYTITFEVKKKIKILVTMNICLWPHIHIMGLAAL